MDKNSTIVMKKNLKPTDLAGEKVMIDFETGKYFMIKGSGNVIWDTMKDGITVSEIIDKLMDEYDVDREVCTKDTIAFIESLVERGIIKVG